jgi:hypothetical protein
MRLTMDCNCSRSLRKVREILSAMSAGRLAGLESAHRSGQALHAIVSSDRTALIVRLSAS